MKTTNTCTPDFKVKDQCSYKVWMEQQEDWREVEWKEKQLYNPCMLSQILCSDASPAKSTVGNLPQILQIHAIWMSRSSSDCSIVSFWIHRPERTTRPSGSILVSCVCVCVPKLRSCWAATMGDSLLHSPDCELEFCLIEGFVRGSASDVICVLPILHLDLIWMPRTALFPCVHTAAVCPLMLLASNLLSSLSRPTCWGSVSHWLAQEERHCFWKPATGHGTMGQEQNQ